MFLDLTILLNITLFRLCVCVEGVKIAPPPGQRVTYIDIPKLDNVRRANVFFHQKSNLKIPTSDWHVVYIGNLTLENRYLANMFIFFMFFPSKIRSRKTDVRPTCYLHRKSDVRKPMSSQHAFFIGNLTSKNQYWTNVLYTSGIRPTSGQRDFLIRNLSSGLRVFFTVTDVGQTYFFHQKSDVGKPIQADVFFLIENPTSEN